MSLPDGLPLLLLVYAFLVVPSLVLTALVAFAVRQWARGGSRGRRTLFAILCTIWVPGAMAGWGLYIAAPWPWRTPAERHDGFPPGPLLLSAAAIAVPFAYLIVRMLFRRRGAAR